MQQQSLLDYYKAIEGASQRMLMAAQREDWEQVMQLEGACAVLIEQLHHQSQVEPLASEYRSEKGKIMLRILRNDALIRNLAEPRLSDIQRLLDGGSRLLH